MKLTTKRGLEIDLTTDHAASSYGIPVAVINGVAYGPGDRTPRQGSDELDWMPEDPMRITVAAAMNHTFAGMDTFPADAGDLYARWEMGIR